MPDQLEIFVVEEMLDILASAGEEIVQAKYVGALGNLSLAVLRAEEAGAAGHQNSLLQMHATIPF